MAQWIPIVGRSISDATRQAGDWARYNAGVEEGDIARANAAEQNWNRWNANVANLQRSDEATQYDRGLQSDAITRQEFQWGMGRKDAAASDALRAKLEREKIAATLGLKTENETKDLAAIENAANNYTRTVDQRGKALDTAEAIWKAATAKLNSATSSVIQEYGDELIRFDPSRNVKAFVPKDTTKPEAVKAATAANARIAEIATQHTLAQDALESADRSFADLQKQLGNFHLGADKRDGKWVVINPMAAPGKEEYRWIPQATVGPPRPVPGATPPGRWNAPPMTVAPMQPPGAPPVATSQAQAIRTTFPTPDHVRDAARNGHISRDQAIEILTTAF